MKFIDPDHPFYRPLWRRLLLVGTCAAWTAVEFYNGEETWGTIFLVVSAYAFAQLILFFKPSDPVATPVDEEPKSDSISSRSDVAPASDNSVKTEL